MRAFFCWSWTWQHLQQGKNLAKATRQSQKLVLNLANVTFLILEHLPSKPSIVTTIKPHCAEQSSAKGWGEGRSGVLVYRVVLKGLVAKLGTGFVANNPLSPPPLPAPSLPLNYNCTKARSIICTAVRVAAIIPPTFSGSGGDLKAGLPIFSSIHQKFWTITSALFPWTLCDWLSRDFQIWAANEKQ